MKLYLKILHFIIPYWKSISIAVLLTFIYVIFNNLSLWVVVNFVEEIFSSDYVNAVKQVAPVNEVATTTVNEVNLYRTINNFIKGILIQEDRYQTLIAVCFVIFCAYLIKNLAIYSKNSRK